LNTAKVVLLFVLTKYFSTFIRIIFYFFLHPYKTTDDTQQHTDRHSFDRFRASGGRTLAPFGMPHALSRAPSVPSRTPSPGYALGDGRGVVL